MSFITIYRQIKFMGIEYNKIILNIKRRPSSKYIMVAIPMYMYRVETNEFSHGLNFFQKTVLKFKAKPGIQDETIANFLGLDSKLVTIVTNELKSKGLINEHGSLSDKGKEKLWEVDGLVVDSGKKKIGYFLKYVNKDKPYPYYVSKLSHADIFEDGRNHCHKIITGTKGDGDDYTEVPFYLEELLKARINLPSPTPKEVLQIIQNSDKRGIQPEDTNDEKTEKLSGQLAIKIVNEQPEIIAVCTYIYLNENEDGSFDPEWRVLDPFGYGDNTGLKFYLNNKLNNNLLESIEKKFADIRTIKGKILSDFQEQLRKLVDEKLTDFYFGLNLLDINLQQYIELIVKNYILQQNHNFSDLDSSVSFSLNLQNIVENILKLDKEKRLDIYMAVYRDYDNDQGKKREALIALYRQKLFSTETQVPQKLLNSSKGTLSRSNSLMSYMVSFMLTYNYDNNSPLFKVFRNRVDALIEVANLRNEKGHGQISKEKVLKPLSKEEVEKYYIFIRSLINDYIQYQ